MPPVNRNNPVRAKSSESSYTLMEFIREFPDDDTCLEHLWRKGYSPDGEHTTAPSAKRYARSSGMRPRNSGSLGLALLAVITFTQRLELSFTNPRLPCISGSMRFT